MELKSAIQSAILPATQSAILQEIAKHEIKIADYIAEKIADRRKNADCIAEKIADPMNRIYDFFYGTICDSLPIPLLSLQRAWFNPQSHSFSFTALTPERVYRLDSFS